MFDPTQTEILLQKIEIMERRGNADGAAALRAELASYEPEQPDFAGSDTSFDVSVTTTCFASGAGISETAKLMLLSTLPKKIAAKLNRYRVLTVEDLKHWDARRLLLIPGMRSQDVAAIAKTLTRLGMPNVLGSAESIPQALPELDPGAIDRLAGRLDEDVDYFLRKLAAGEDERTVSAEMGAKPAWYGYPHQCAQSLKSRHHARYVQFLLEQFKTEFKQEDWLVSASIERTSVARCRANKGDPERAAWRLRPVIRVSEEEAIKRLAGAVKVRGRWYWRSVGIGFEKTDGSAKPPITDIEQQFAPTAQRR